MSLIPGISVMFDLQGGTCPDAGSRTYMNGDLYGPLPLPEYVGKTFSGWYSTPAGDTRIFPDWRVFGSNHTLYAVWDKYTPYAPALVSFSLEGGVSWNAGTRVYSSGQQVYGVFPEVTRTDGKVLEGWFTAPVGGLRVFEDRLVGLPDHTLYARWYYPQPAYGAVYFLGEGGTVLGGQFVFTYAYSGLTYGEVVGGPLPVAARDGYKFLGWWSSPAGGGRMLSVDMPTGLGGNILWYARWEALASGEVDNLDVGTFRSVDGWVSITLEKVVGSLPAALLEAYRGWVTEADRKQRLSLILEGVMFDYRGAVDADNHPVGELDATSVPVSLLRNVLTTIWYTLGVELGLPAASMQEYRSGWYDSNVVLRSLFLELRTGRNRFRSGSGWSPTYSARKVSDAVAAVSSGTGRDVPPVNYNFPPPG